MYVHRNFPNSLDIQCKYLVAMATDSDVLLPLSPHPSLLAPLTWLFLWVGPLVSVVERIRRAVIRHSGASCSPHHPTGTWMFCCLLDPRLTKTMGRAIIGPLSSGGAAVQVLTVSTISGWAALCGVLGRYSGMGYILGTIAGTSSPHFTLPSPCGVVFVSSILSF